MAFNFPNSPSDGQEFSPGTGVTYIYYSPRWLVKPSAADKTYVDAQDAALAAQDATITAAMNTADNLRVLKSGDAMTGDLTINKAWPTLYFNRSDNTTTTQYQAKTNNVPNWNMSFGEDAAANFALDSYNDSGGFVGRPITVNRLTGIVDFAVPPTVAGGTFTELLSYNGMQTNGGMLVSQELGAAGINFTTGTSGHVLDGWRGGSSGQTINVIQSAAAPSGYTASLQISPVTANASPSGSDYAALTHFIEGYRVARLAFGAAGAIPFTMGFWVYAFRAGMYSGAVNNGSFGRSYTFNFTINASNTWEWKTITIPGDTTGTWLKTNGIGMTIQFCAMLAASLTLAPGSWTNGGYLGTTGNTNSMQTLSDKLAITGLIILPGTKAPTAAQSSLIMRPYSEELLTCKRYYQRYPSIVVDIVAAAQSIVLPVEMRGVPVISGGGAGFTSDPKTTTLLMNQTTRAYQDIRLDARY